MLRLNGKWRRARGRSRSHLGRACTQLWAASVQTPHWLKREFMREGHAGRWLSKASTVRREGTATWDRPASLASASRRSSITIADLAKSSLYWSSVKSNTCMMKYYDIYGFCVLGYDFCPL